MTIIQAVILGIVQGLTEFLPVSSSAHLVLVPFLFNWKLDPAQAFVFDVLVQLGTLGAVIAYFWKDLLTILKAWADGLRTKTPFADAESRLGWLIILGTIPAGVAGLFLKDKVEAAFSDPMLTAVMLFLTAVLLTLAEVFSKKTRDVNELTWLDALIIGAFQAIAIFPGISRSGATISGGLFRGLKRQNAARYSFLLAIPIMAAAGLMAFSDLLAVPGLSAFLPVVIVGFVAAALVGYFAIRWFLSFLKAKSLLPFALYCALLSIGVLLVMGTR
ncbi:MAG: undecaprenyl-diphosphatase UppP [Chloroflexi bacterium]|jgi:undecaprenyl-diphosphatase|nr:undecaprenyl-diphosphatase UppP [Anaerolineaceae bacterium]NLI43998.1 undecaprenyl-diphosphatase UppP [Chloroflexota bacterium]HOE34280.1 undecaprenyl-diphosphatase UppP [Anaerolineaceae bacterium]HOT25880.1 undecaprenyl-diphosphatase UppP [Anaerolineaceae bacterium]HQH58029.1 undecaprenyl-diphosphatase UppP [Anaerolineaceae bacterium]